MCVLCCVGFVVAVVARYVLLVVCGGLCVLFVGNRFFCAVGLGALFFVVSYCVDC